MNILANIEEIKQRMSHAASAAGRAPEDVTLVAVTKTVDALCAKKVLEAGVLNLGENRVQVFLDKYDVLGNEPRWHLIGHLQTNKVKYIIGKVQLIHSVDSLHLAEEISKKAQNSGIVQNVLVQFNISGEESKSGADADEAKALFEKLSCLKGISVRGLMTMAPLRATETETRHVFEELRLLSEQIAKEGYDNVFMEHLSMGMSGDFEAAIREGATLVRIGNALFK